MSKYNVLFHTVVTEGYIAWAELYIEALRSIYGDDVPIRIDAFNISHESEKFLRKSHGNLDLHTTYETWEEISDNTNVNINKLLLWKEEIEHGRINDENFWYKIYITVNQRYRRMLHIVDDTIRKGYDFLLHTDVDLYLRNRLDNFLENIYDSNIDFAAYFRDTSKCIYKILGAFLVIRLNQNINIFMKEWMAQIDNYPYAKRWRGFGQSVIWYAYQNTKDKLNIADIHEINDAPVYSKKFDIKSDIWLNSNSFIKSNSIKSLPRAISWEDLKQKRPVIEPFVRHNFKIKYKSDKLYISYELL